MGSVQDAAYGFADDLEVTLGGAAGAGVGLVDGKQHGLPRKEAFNFENGLLHVVEAGADINVHISPAAWPPPGRGNRDCAGPAPLVSRRAAATPAPKQI